MLIRNLMTTPPVCVCPDTSVRDVAVLMKTYDIGTIPIVSEVGVVGIVTDRDLVLRLLTQTGSLSEVPASQAMSTDLITCFADQDVTEAAAIMGDNQVRRLPVLDRSGELLGVLSVGDIAENASEELAGQALGEIIEDR
jgi:CBS domain-containing protein